MCLQMDEESRSFRCRFSNWLTVLFVVIKAIPRLMQTNEASFTTRACYRSEKINRKHFITY